MSTDTCIWCGSKDIHHGNGWTSLICNACERIRKEDANWNQERIKAYYRKEINIEELRAGYRNRIRDMYYSTAPEGA